MRRQLALLRGLVAAVVLGLACSAGTSVRAETILVMVEEAGCIWCAQWNRDIAPIYPKTPEGQAAPLVRIDIHGDRPADMEFTNRLTFTPTFILMKNGREVSRIEGYPGEDFFWGLLGQMLEEAQSGHDRSG